jgi:hypothetical protein
MVEEPDLIFCERGKSFAQEDMRLVILEIETQTSQLICQSALKRNPGSAWKRDPGRGLVQVVHGDARCGVTARV